jgi:hypothetical protein
MGKKIVKKNVYKFTNLCMVYLAKLSAIQVRVMACNVGRLIKD